ncbi:hypothetical protein OIE73_29325 [Streptomyces hirsutus]|uniref:Uncharacterized protein n=1 Tax=Streptomyces hirsutus TaxID=35620 RepID=A0ABZ1GTC9_9ACTN|nr:hypothetical protein [Streptomyces hirsutus]WSD09448.1 hypothetical protein OIE73_29325 [Streptomyces hirsutus]
MRATKSRPFQLAGPNSSRPCFGRARCSTRRIRVADLALTAYDSMSSQNARTAPRAAT